MLYIKEEMNMPAINLRCKLIKMMRKLEQCKFPKLKIYARESALVIRLQKCSPLVLNVPPDLIAFLISRFSCTVAHTYRSRNISTRSKRILL